MFYFKNKYQKIEKPVELAHTFSNPTNEYLVENKNICETKHCSYKRRRRITEKAALGYIGTRNS